MTTDSNESTRVQLEQQAQQLTAEHTALQRQIDELQQQLVTLDGLYAQAERRYELQSDASAADEMNAFITDRITIEATIIALQRQVVEMPARITALYKELKALAYHDHVQRMLEIRLVELEAYSLYEQTMLDALDAFQTLWHATHAADVLFEAADHFARTNHLPRPKRGKLAYPVPNEHWFRGSVTAYRAVKDEFERTRANLPTVE